MSAWTSDELHRIEAAEELQIAPRRHDGNPRKPVTIWVVRHGDDLYVRSYRGRSSAWFQSVQDRHEGHISAGGVDKDVLFVEAGDDVNDAIDAAYQLKYRRYADNYVPPLLTLEARATTLRLVPRVPEG